MRLLLDARNARIYTFSNKGHWEIAVHEFENKRTGERGAEIRYPAIASELSSSSGNAT